MTITLPEPILTTLGYLARVEMSDNESSVLVSLLNGRIKASDVKMTVKVRLVDKGLLGRDTLTGLGQVVATLACDQITY